MTSIRAINKPTETQARQIPKLSSTKIRWSVNSYSPGRKSVKADQKLAKTVGKPETRHDSPEEGPKKSKASRGQKERKASRPEGTKIRSEA